MTLYGCDTFVVLPPLTKSDTIIFGKNSDRPQGEVQEIVYIPSQTFGKDEKLQCTFIEIDQIESTYSVLLSKPSWMWGAEMGANSCGVVIGNEAVWTVVDDNYKTERLLGMDLLRLALERSATAKDAVSTITTLLEVFGQGGPCSETDSELFYHNSYLIVDIKEAWVVETAGHLWAAEKITSGHRNISNCLSIGKNITLMSDQLIPYAKKHGLWKGESEFSFKDAFSSGGCYREVAGHKLLVDLTSDKQFEIQGMFNILRDKNSTICMPAGGSYHTSGSWVSVLRPNLHSLLNCHWVTGTPDPSVSIFKPFIFSPHPDISSHISSPLHSEDPAKMKPRFQFKVDRKHILYGLHGKYLESTSFNIKDMKELEGKFLKNTESMLEKLNNGASMSCVPNDLLKMSVEEEMELYSKSLASV